MGEDSSQGSGSSAEEAAGDASAATAEASTRTSTERARDGGPAGEKRLLARKTSEERKEKT